MKKLALALLLPFLVFHLEANSADAKNMEAVAEPDKICFSYAEIHLKVAKNDVVKGRVISNEKGKLTCYVEGMVTVKDFTGHTRIFKHDTLEISISSGTYEVAKKKKSYYLHDHK